MQKDSRQRQFVGLAGWLFLVFAAAATGAVASTDAGSFYAQLVRPQWAPPAWLFGPVWSVLYLFMAIAAWLVWRTHGFQNTRAAFVLFVTQLAANALWTWLFFAWRQGGLAFVEILVLWILIVLTFISFWRLRVRAAAILLMPYLAWVTFAVVLNFSIWQLNPDLLG